MTGAREGRRGGAWTARSRVVTGGIGMLGRIQVMPRWADDPVQRDIGVGGVGEGGGLPHRRYIRGREER